ncbi:phosphoesterase family-domain-containing protein [Phycomyces nitens]|nr:phosphoesterase family-domain-containing protein [Phycomyces nitens]
MRVSIATFITLASLATAFVSAKPSHKAPKGKAFDHILQIWFENQDFEVIDALPHFNQLKSQGILLTNYNAITHPSEPNYIAAAGGSNFGIDDDDYYNIPSEQSSIFDLLENKKLTWKLYEEDIPSTGFTGDNAGHYVRKHNPAVSFDSIGLNKKRLRNIVNSKQFAKDIESGDLPNWMFYTPNMLNDGHDTNATYASDWFDKFYKSTLNNKKLLSKTLVLVTFDENATYSRRNRVWSILLGDIPHHLKGTRDDTYYTHYSSLNTVENNWDLGNMGRGDSIRPQNNVYAHLAKRLRYKNVDLPESEIPMNNDMISVGLVHGHSLNDTIGAKIDASVRHL